FREQENSRYVALTLPRVLARLPYKGDANPVKAFRFEQSGGREDHLWMSAAYAFGACCTRAVTQYGIAFAIVGRVGGGMVEGLPTHADETEHVGPTEIRLGDRRSAELDKLGFMPLDYHLERVDEAAFLTARSTQKPKKYDTEWANAFADIL